MSVKYGLDTMLRVSVALTAQKQYYRLTIILKTGLIKKNSFLKPSAYHTAKGDGFVGLGFWLSIFDYFCIFLTNATKIFKQLDK